MIDPQRIRNLIAAAGMSQGQFGRAIGKSARTIRDYLSGDKPIPETVARIVRVCEKDERFLDLMEGADENE